jgi:hypothetical protein
MSQRKKPVDPTDGPVAALAHELQQLRQSAGLAYDGMVPLAHYSKTTLASADSGARLPTREVIHAYVTACGGDTGYFDRRWQEVAELVAALSPRTDRAANRTARATSPLPDPTGATTVGEYLDLLEQLRRWAGHPTYRELSERARLLGLRLPRSSLGDMLTGKRPGGDCSALLKTYLRVCGLSDAEIGVWLDVRARVGGSRTALPLRRSFSMVTVTG